MDQSLKLSPLKIAQYTVSFLLAGGLFWYLYREQDLGQMLANIAQANFWWIGASIVVSLWAHLSRGIRWAIMLKPLGYHTGDTRPFLAVMVGYLANLVLPRMGEVSRSLILQRLRGVPFNVSFGAVIAERVIDLLMLIALTGVAFWLEFDRLRDFLASLFSQPAAPGQGSGKWLPLAVVASVGLLGLLGLYVFRKRILAHPLAAKGLAFLAGLKDGLLSIGKLTPRDRVLFGLHTIVIWLNYYLTSYVLFFSVAPTAQLDWHCALAILAMSGISIVAPVQGGIGVYHFLVAGTLVAYGVAEGPAKEFAFMAHSSQMLMFIVVGGACLLLSLVLKPKKVGAGEPGTDPSFGQAGH
jgi:glycosyltransferase 2 family protein